MGREGEREGWKERNESRTKKCLDIPLEVGSRWIINQLSDWFHEVESKLAVPLNFHPLNSRHSQKRLFLDCPEIYRSTKDKLRVTSSRRACISK